MKYNYNMDDKNYTSTRYNITWGHQRGCMGYFISIGGTFNISDDDCNEGECEVEPIPCHNLVLVEF